MQPCRARVHLQLFLQSPNVYVMKLIVRVSNGAADGEQCAFEQDLHLSTAVLA